MRATAKFGRSVLTLGAILGLAGALAAAGCEEEGPVEEAAEETGDGLEDAGEDVDDAIDDIDDEIDDAADDIDDSTGG